MTEQSDLLIWEPSVGSSEPQIALLKQEDGFRGGGRTSVEKNINRTFFNLEIRNGVGEFWKQGMSWTETRARDC